jgi:dipeptidyl aminopeptidase/acylaminoacyl peptidase
MILWCGSALIPAPAADTAKKPLSLPDMMKFKHIHDPAISEMGDWVVYSIKPDRGNSEAVFFNIDHDKSHTIPRGEKPVITKNSLWAAAAVQPDAAELEKKSSAKKKDDSGPKPGMALLDTSTGKIVAIERVKGFTFSGDSKWLVYALFPVEKTKDEKDKENKEDKKKDKKKKKKEAVTLVLRHLDSGGEIRIDQVAAYALDPASRFIAYTVYDYKDPGDKDPVKEAQNNSKSGLFIRDLTTASAPGRRLHGDADPDARTKYSNLAWSKKKSRLAFILHEETAAGEKETKSGKKAYSSSLVTWDGLKDKSRVAVPGKKVPAGWLIPKENQLKWSKDQRRLFFGLKPEDEYRWTLGSDSKTPPKDEDAPVDLYDTDQLLEKRGVDVWHWQDPLINPNQKKNWERLKKRTYTAVYHWKEDRFVQLTDKKMRELEIPENPDFALAAAPVYQREMTWDDWYVDRYVVNLQNGARRKILTHHNQRAHLSFNGGFVLFYKDKHWHLYDIRRQRTRNLTASIETPFYNEDHDYPEAVPGYRMAGWTENDREVLIYDKYDIWAFSTASGKPLCLTGGEGRKNKISFRIQELDPEREFFKNGERLLLTGHSHKKKYTIFYTASVGQTGVQRLIPGEDAERKHFAFQAKAKNADRILYTRENFEEYPDLWISNQQMETPRKISNVNPQMEDFIWGKAELVEWNSMDGIPLQGVVIKPGNYDSAKRYPVLVYYYRFMSQRLHRFNQVVVNHRPCFPYYAGHGYVVFLPDIRFETGRPGFSAVKCLVPGVQKLIDMGIADAKAIGLHGHSWSGYQTAFVVTQTDIFAAAVAGAPVSNMTSAYSGIRWGSGMARQFQYEKSQSRIGPPLIEAPHLYIQNSPVFYADRINTPLLIQFGDKDEAVPWYQGIELYLAMRRLDKNCIFLQYNDEPHHLKKYPNKLDYTIKMKEFLDHYLQGKPAPPWMTRGVPYKEK